MPALSASRAGRASSSENKKPTSLADVYGSTWITAGAGSVILLWGGAGDLVVELTHLKPPGEAVGPFELLHDHDRGVTTRRADRPDVRTVLQGATSGGVTAADVAQAVYGGSSAPQIEKAPRKLEKLVTEEKAARIEPAKNGDPVVYRPTPRNGSVSDREGSREGFTRGSRRSREPGNTAHAPLTHPSTAPPRSGWVERDRIEDVNGAPADWLDELPLTDEDREQAISANGRPATPVQYDPMGDFA